MKKGPLFVFFLLPLWLAVAPAYSENQSRIRDLETQMQILERDFQAVFQDWLGIERLNLAVRADQPPAIQRKLGQLQKDRADLKTKMHLDKKSMEDLRASFIRFKAEANPPRMEMIKLQSLMSARGTAIQLSTNMIKSINDNHSKIVENLKDD
jgi:predicted  nucleic acid-binding Zn-ribbon protein